MNSIAKSFNSVYTLLSPTKTMSHPAGMQTLASRLASFEAPKPKGKKRTSTKNQKTASAWPLETPTAEQLAQAGFFLTATASSPDNVTCFHCLKSLDEWEEGDNPFQEHLQFAPECAWAVTMAVERGVIPRDDEHDPLAEEFVDVRTATFGTSWPHENKKGWTCKIKKLVDAGWHYHPTPDEDDQTKCAYCNLCVSGWEPKDKPIEEHKRRSPECSFFRLTQLHKKTRAKKSRASKASRASTISTATWAREPSPIVDTQEDDGEANIDDSIMTTATDMTNASTATNATTKKAGRPKKSTTKSTRGKKKADAVIETEEPESPEEGQAQEIIEPEVKAASPVQQTGKGRKRSSAVMLEEDEDDIVPASKKRTRDRSSTVRPEPAPLPISQETTEPGAELDMGNQSQPQSLTQESTMDFDQAEPIAMPKRGSQKAARGSAASRSASGATARKTSGTRKASQRKDSSVSASVEIATIHHQESDAQIEAKLEADLDRPLSDEEMEAAPVEKSKPKRGPKAKQPAKRTVSKQLSKPVEQPKVQPRLSVEEDDDMEEDELAQMDQPRHVPAEKLFANHYEEQPSSGKPSSHETDEDADNKPRGRKTVKEADAAPKPKRGRPPKKKIVEPIVEPKDEEPEVDAEEEKPTELRFSSSFEEMPSESEEIIPPAKVRKVSTKRDAPVSRASKAAAPAKALKAPAATKKGKGKTASAVLTKPEEPEVIEAPAPVAKRSTPPPPSPVPREATPEEVAPTPAAPTPGAFPSPTPSPQSSNAENEPPSSRPSNTRPPLAALTPNRAVSGQTPFGSAAPTTPSRSIARAGNDGGSVSPEWALKSGYPWRAVEIENVFLPSPESKRSRWITAPEAAADGKENSQPLRASKDVKDAKKPGSAAAAAAKEKQASQEKQEKMRQLRSLLTSPEKRMTVEEWIRWNASRGEEKLRGECERVVGRFESEGIRAMKALEGLVVEEWA